MKTAFIFDMDGTLLDSERLILNCYLDEAARRGLHASPEIYARTVGLSPDGALGVYTDEYGEAAGTALRRAVVAETLRRIEAEGIPVRPGAEALLEQLRAAGCPLVLATSNSRERAASELERAGLLRFFRYLVCSDDVTHAKPHPEIFERAAAHCGDAERIFVVEDSPNGVRAAAAAGLPALLVPDLIEPDGALRALAAQIFPDLTALRLWLAERIPTPDAE